MRARRNEGLAPLEIALLLCIIGVALAVFVPTFVRSVRTSKISEASDRLALLQHASASYFEADRDGRARGCLPEAAGPSPSEPSVDATEVDFGADGSPGAATFSALGFPPGAVRYRYTFQPVRSGCGLAADAGTGSALALRAEGDLDGDGELSTFEREARISEDGRLVPFGVLRVHRMPE